MRRTKCLIRELSSDLAKPKKKKEEKKLGRGLTLYGDRYALGRLVTSCGINVAQATV